jgi:RNA polymerase sigma-70 factor, ECF subfamily
VNSPTTTAPEAPDLAAARRGDEDAFARLIAPVRGELHAHCYRMLGSAHDAEDALQETLLRAWRGLPRFEGRSSLRSWLYKIATNVSLRAIERRRKRILPVDYGPSGDPHDGIGAPIAESVWVEPFPDAGLEDGRAAPDARYEQRESVELAFIAALQHLPERQRAVLLMRDVLGFKPAEIAEALDSTPASVYSALQRAHKVVDERLPERSQQETLRSIDDERLREVVERFVAAWEANDVDALVAMLTEDAEFSMPPIPDWYRGRDAIAVFLASRPMSAAERWRLVPTSANGQPAFATYGREADGRWYAHGIQIITVDSQGAIAAVTGFLDPEAFRHFGLPHELTS